MITIKVIDLLNKIANGEEVAKEIKVNDNIYHYDETDCNEFYRYRTMTNELLTDYADLSDKVEILEEEKKLPEKLEEIGNIDYNLGYIDYKNIEVLKNWLNNDIQSILNELDLIVKNQNQIIDYLKSKEKGE